MAHVQHGRYDELLRGLMDVAGEWIAPGICTELIPVVVTEPGNPSHCFGRRERLASYAGYSAAVAGNFSALRIRNNIEGQALVIVSSLSVQHTATDMYRISLSELAGDLTTAGPAPTLRDTRLASYDLAGVPGPSNILTSQGAVAAVPTANSVARIRGPANGMAYFLEPIVLAPGGELQVTRETVNLPLYCNFHWQEVPMSLQQMA